MKLRDKLKQVGCQIDEGTLRDVVAELHHAMHRGWTSEDLLHHPHDAQIYCNAVRARTAANMLSDRIILETLTNLRKAGGLKKAS